MDIESIISIGSERETTTPNITLFYPQESDCKIIGSTPAFLPGSTNDVRGLLGNDPQQSSVFPILIVYDVERAFIKSEKSSEGIATDYIELPTNPKEREQCVLQVYVTDTAL